MTYMDVGNTDISTRVPRNFRLTGHSPAIHETSFSGPENLSLRDSAIVRKSSLGLLHHPEQQAHCVARSLTITLKIISASGSPTARIYGQVLGVEPVCLCRR